MTETRGDYKTRFKEHPTEELAKKIVGVALPIKIDEYVRSLPNRSEWLRKAIAEAYQKEVGARAANE